MSILKFLNSVAEGLTKREFADCDAYLNIQMDEPETMSHRDEEKLLHSVLIGGVVYNFEMDPEDC